jgi:hypothetical protein
MRIDSEAGVFHVQRLLCFDFFVDAVCRLAEFFYGSLDDNNNTTQPTTSLLFLYAS